MTKYPRIVPNDMTIVRTILVSKLIYLSRTVKSNKEEMKVKITNKENNIILLIVFFK